jgi:hypothetical protein
MPSAALQTWRTARRAALDELEAAHRSVGGTAPGRRFATQQINQAYAVLLSSQFQGYCRELHTECTTHFVQRVPAGPLRTAMAAVILHNRKLSQGNPNPGNIGADFNRFGLLFWDEVVRLTARNEDRRDLLQELNTWRNAIAHQDLDPAVLGMTILRVRKVRRWRAACDRLATSFDEVVRSHLQALNGVSPW